VVYAFRHGRGVDAMKKVILAKPPEYSRSTWAAGDSNPEPED
jgi:hypothetical protein